MASVVEVIVRPHHYLRKHGVRGFMARLVMRPLAPFSARRVRALDKGLFERVPILRKDQGLTIGFSPHFPHVNGYQITKVCKALSLRMVEGTDADIRMFWHDTTVAPAAPKGAINWRVRDISKGRVGEIFDRVFPYSLTVDPATYSGKCVEKVDENGLHVASVVQCPRPRLPGYAYQRLIDNSVGNDVLDLRAVIVGSEIPVVYAKRRPIHDRFSNMNKSVALAVAPFTHEEVNLIRAFCAEMGLDYGEIDILRDKDGRIYIVDVNKTTFGPPNHLPMPKRLEAIELIAQAFERQFL